MKVGKVVGKNNILLVQPRLVTVAERLKAY